MGCRKPRKWGRNFISRSIKLIDVSEEGNSFFLGLLYYPKNRDDMFFRNVAQHSLDYMVSHPRRQKFSLATAVTASNPGESEWSVSLYIPDRRREHHSLSSLGQLLDTGKQFCDAKRTYWNPAQIQWLTRTLELSSQGTQRGTRHHFTAPSYY
jgi:hypothetical protein